MPKLVSKMNMDLRAPPAATAEGPGVLLAYVGCRTTVQRRARGKGLRVFRLGRTSGDWCEVQVVAGLENPAYLAMNRAGRHLYVVHGDGTEISAYAVDAVTGCLRALGGQSIGGRNPVHLLIDDERAQVLVANYAAGNVAMLPIRPDGSLGPVQGFVALPGEPGPHAVEQRSSHPHQLVADRVRGLVYVPDKGLDRIFSLSFNGGGLPSNALAATSEAPSGAGPRHMALSELHPLVYVVHELDSSVGVYSVLDEAGSLELLQVAALVPERSAPGNTGAGITLSHAGRFLHVSNRGHDSIATFAVDSSSGLLGPPKLAGTRGRGPRFITLDPTGTQLVVANELSDAIATFDIDAEHGGLTPAGPLVATGSPTCIVFSAIAAASNRKGISP